MIFTCQRCGQDVCASIYDRDFLERRGWLCANCYWPIAGNLFPTDGKAVFVLQASSPALGDYLVLRHLVDYYSERNPKATVQILEADERWTAELVESKTGADVIFWGNTGGVDTAEWKKSRVVWVNPHADGWELWRRGFYPRSPWRLEPVGVELPARYVAFSARNVAKCPEKNMPAEEFTAVLDACDVPIVLIGNDCSFGFEFLWGDKLIDLRGRLSLGQIGTVLKNAALYVGRDSGMAHYAACFPVPAVVWGFERVEWFPRQRPGLGLYLMGAQSLELIQEVVRWKCEGILSTCAVETRIAATC